MNRDDGAYHARPDETADLRSRRKALIREVIDEARSILRHDPTGRLGRAVVRAMLAVPRERFIPQHDAVLAYANTALTIGHGQTISQPLIVALMSHLLQVGPEHTVLEVGTGSGYQAAVLSKMVMHVYTIETVQALGIAARELLHHEHYENVTVRVGDGAEGWPEHAPYDGVIVTAAARTIPAALVDQLRPGGHLVMPVEEPDGEQWLVVLHKHDNGYSSTRRVLPVRFVPLTGPGAAADGFGAS
ncbi:MAG: protein-L-isoaspartate(D-aspartate) O-methyltransferase [Gammaproteobacteria bacterium]|nr:protein-L-isoaspartate(D-aspartate) O-methyltransferase [Gammaproteobacteria bacterium]